MNAAKLYTAEVLGLAMELAACPPIVDAAVTGEARSPACGSTLTVGLRLDAGGRVDAVGLHLSACAIGQASAALFARHVRGRNQGEIAKARAQIAAWLGGNGPLPDWPDFALLEPARSYPGRHGAILLPWQAAVSALPSVATPA